MPSQFKKGKIINHDDAKKLNAAIGRLILQIDDADLRPRAKFETLTKEHISLSEQKQTRSASTIRYYGTELKKFIAFAGNIDVSEITPDLLEKYHAYMVSEGNSNNTVWKAFKFIKTIINKAIAKGLIEKNPFHRMPDRVKYQQSNRSFLTADEVNKIAAANLPEFQRHIADWFLFQCQTGLAISDIRKVNLEIVRKENRILAQRTKTSVPVSIPLSKEAAKIITRLQPLTITDVSYNRMLKTIAHGSGVNKPLSSHIARHTFAMRLAELKISKETAGKLLGHTKTSTTDIYYKIQDKRVLEEFEKFGY